MKLTFGIIVLNGDFFLQQILESIYPVAHAICIAEGPVQYHYHRGVMVSNDDTLKIIRSFPDPQHKIKVVHEYYKEKTEQCRAWFNMVPMDTDYIICNDADEVHTPQDIETLVKFLEEEDPTSVGFVSDSFYGGFDRVIGGFEREHSFKRVLKYFPGSFYRTHRQPTLSSVPANQKDDSYDIVGKDITGVQLYEATGITMWHGSYVSPKAVKEKIDYYEHAVIAKGLCIEDYFNEVYLKWVLGSDEEREAIEEKYNGVQEFNPHARGASRTQPYIGQHPLVIQRDMGMLKTKFRHQLNEILLKN